MRVAIFSDVHGNLTALEAVLQDIKEKSPDLVLFAGDLCMDGARPAECVARLRDSTIAGVHGNTDLELTNKPLLDDDSLWLAEQRIEDSLEGNLRWTWAQLSEMDRAWLGTLPFHRRVSPTPHPKDDILVVHANPKDVNQHIFPSEAKQKEWYGEVQQADDDLELRKMVGDLEGGIVAFGHLHRPFIRRWGDLTLANISSVSLPLDDDARAKYGLFTWNNGAWNIEHQYVEYDVEKELAVLKSIQPTNWKELGAKLKGDRVSA